MAGWNRPNAANQPVVKQGGTKSPSKVTGIVAGAIVVALGALCLWMFSGGDDSPKVKLDKERGRIKEVTPAKAPTNAVAQVEKKKPYWEVDASQTNGFSKAMQLKWVQMHRPKLPVPHVERPRLKFEIFDHHTENLIAGTLTAEPGKGMFLGRLSNLKRLNQDFLESCKVPIIVKETDDEYTKQLKRAVNEAKIEIKARMDNGESFGEIIDKEREELNVLARYKNDLVNEVRQRIKSENPSAEDIQLYQDAVNKMLEAKGVAPITLGPIAKQKIMSLYKNNKSEGSSK